MTTNNSAEAISKGDRVEWEYTHYLNRRSSMSVIKTGIVVRIIKRKKKFLSDWDANPRVLVLFDGNKCGSRVHIFKLKKVNHEQ